MKAVWKVIPIVAIMFSIVALIAVARAGKSDAEQIKSEVHRQLAEREQALVSRCKDTINRMRADVGQPQKDIKTMEDALDGFIRIFDIVGELPDKTPPSPK